MTERCRQCGRESVELRKRSHHIAVWCVGCADWCQPGKWIPHVVLVAKGVNLKAVQDAPNDPVPPPHPSLFDAA